MSSSSMSGGDWESAWSPLPFGRLPSSPLLPLIPRLFAMGCVDNQQTKFDAILLESYTSKYNRSDAVLTRRNGKLQVQFSLAGQITSVVEISPVAVCASPQPSESQIKRSCLAGWGATWTGSRAGGQHFVFACPQS